MKCSRLTLRLVLPALLLALALVGCGEEYSSAPDTTGSPPAAETSASSPSATTTPPPATKPPPKPRPKPSPVRLVGATVTRVVDGDTAAMRLAGGRIEKVRFIGVDTPESTIEHEPYGKEASRFTESRLAGRQVYLEVGTEQRDRYGRLLAYVWLARPVNLADKEIRQKQFNAQLLVQGYAQLLTIPPNVDYVEYYRRYQTEARNRDAGLWGLPATTAPKPSSGSGYVGSAKSDKFHHPDCQWAKRISPANLVRFRTRAEALRRGYVPCQVCDP